ncbi:hypothetical protein PAXRUDRAFT_155174, partial [Paxillus rubicundulus Ve08.2h10]
VKFVVLDGTIEILVGHWCTICKEDNRFVVKNGKRKAFHVGGNSSCCQHICGHYELYCEWCAGEKIEGNDNAIP